MDSAKNGRWIIPFKKSDMVRVKILHDDGNDDDLANTIARHFPRNR